MRYGLFVIFLLGTGISAIGQQNSSEALRIKQTANFELSGNGASKTWDATEWNILAPRENEERRDTRFKVLYSNTGIYFLFHSEDEILTASKTADFEKLWLEDVIEVFLWTDTTETTYFEYEISPLNYELPILVPNFDGAFLGWRPWQYEGERKIKHLTHVEGGAKKTGSKITAWYSEFFIPFALLAPLRNVPPRKGTVWKANMYRIDYDEKDKPARWLWKKTETNFHQFTKFGKVIFD
jgi:hypothetical protein